MYSQLLYFVVALLLSAIQDPGSEPAMGPMPTLFFSAGLLVLFGLFCRLEFQRLMVGPATEWADSSLSLRYHRAQTRCSIVALAGLAAHIYVLDIKYYLDPIPGFRQSMALVGLSGLAVFLFHLVILWYHSYPVYQRIHRSHLTRGAFLKSNLLFCLAILIPWMIVAGASDLLQAFEMPEFLQGDLGELLVLGTLLILMVLFAPRLVVHLWGCRPLPASPVRRELEKFAFEHRFRVGDFLLWPLLGGESLTAGIIGVLPRWRYILITRGLLDVLDLEELRGVLAHEMGHARRYHLLIFLVFFLSCSVLIAATDDLMVLAILSHPAILSWVIETRPVNPTLTSALFSVPVVVFLVVYFRYLFGFFLRNSERQADIFAMQVMGHPFPLVSALRKIAMLSGRTENVPSWHHFSIRQRIEFLLAAYQRPGIIRAHHRKYYGSLALFLAMLASVGWGGSHLENSRFVRGWRVDLQMAMIEKAVTGGREDPLVLAAYGGLLLERQQFDRAEWALKRSLELDPENPNVLNNLAWLYATAPPPHFNPEAALKLAGLAAEREPNPAVLDTLAEAYYVNGRPEEALQAIDRALAGKPENLDYLLGQRKKFEAAMGEKMATGKPGE